MQREFFQRIQLLFPHKQAFLENIYPFSLHRQCQNPVYLIGPAIENHAISMETNQYQAAVANKTMLLAWVEVLL